MGFAGLATVHRLTRAGLRVTLVDRNVYSTFQPLLYQVATGGLNPSDVSYPLRGFAYKYGARFQRGELVAIDDAARKVTPARGEERNGSAWSVKGTLELFNDAAPRPDVELYSSSPRVPTYPEPGIHG